ncbi:virulence factor TspB C-terminal domain-related protein [Acinetobacter seifertii]|uniref:virulence factor TspB C-terminal domain-related protein n=1 Tax=Acinetobacter seifertii TaxID=1530123 RepID=UPI003EDEFDE0
MYFRTYTNSYKALLVCIISFFITFTPSLVFATTVAGDGWSVQKRLVQGATTFYDATKNVALNGKNYASTATAAVAPTAAQVSKMIVRTGAVLAVDLAIKSLINGVDYVMDPANNRVKYIKDGYPAGSFPVLKVSGFPTSSIDGIRFSTIDAACLSLSPFTRPSTGVVYRYDKSLGAEFNGAQCILVDSTGGRIAVGYIQFYKFDESKGTESYVGFDTVAAKVISNAEAENADAKVYVSTVADTSLDKDETKQIVPAQTITDQLNSTQSISTSETATGTATTSTPTDPNAPPTKTDMNLKFPVFCGWAPTVCQAAQAAIEFPKTAADWWKTLDTWLTSFVYDDVTEPEQPDYEIQEPDLNLGVQQYISGSAFCPEDRHIPLSMGGQSLDIIISYSALCTVAQQFRPAVILMSFLAGAFIITNTGRRAETGD